MPLINHCNGGAGVSQVCAQIENFKVVFGTTALSARLTWTAPENDEDDSFVGVRIVRKTGSAPTGINDGTVVYEGTALTYTDTGLIEGTTYYYRAFAYNAKKKYQTAMRKVSIVGSSLTVGTSLEDSTWAQIRAVSDAGLASSVWSVGDTKTITINGTVYAYFASTPRYVTFDNKSVKCFILGFDHNSAVESTNRIHFHIGKEDDGKQIGYYASSFNSDRAFIMNNASSGRHWETCEMRTQTLNSDSSSATTPTYTNSLLSALPSDLRAVMKTVTKYTSYDNSTAVSFTEYLPLLAPVEVFGKNIQYLPYTTSATGMVDYTGADEAYQEQYDYYKAGNSERHYLQDGEYINWSTGIKYTGRVWLRSEYNSSYYYCISDNGGLSYYNRSNGALLAPIFFV